MTGLLKRLVEDSLSEVTYNATVSGLRYHLLDSIYGLEVIIRKSISLQKIQSESRRFPNGQIRKS